MISIATSFAPPCFGPRSAPIAPVIAEYRSEPVPAMTRALKVLALNSCSAYSTSDLSSACACSSLGLRPCSRCRKCAAIDSSSVSASMRLPLWLKWYQYSSIEPKLAIRRSAMSRAPVTLWSSFSGSTVPSTEQPVRSTSIGWVDAGSSSIAALTGAGRPRRRFSLAL